MQKPIRYYITTSGEEPTVRSVEVALGRVSRPESVDTVPAAPEPAETRAPVSPAVVTRLVKDAIQKRPRRGA